MDKKIMFIILNLLYINLAHAQSKSGATIGKEQLNEIMTYAKDAGLKDKYRNLISKGKNAYIDTLKSFSWFNNKNEIKKDSIINIIKNDLDVNYSFLALEELSFDAEGFDTAESYRDLINKMIDVAAIKTRINYVEVIDSDNFINISVAIENGKKLTYAVDVNIHGDWLDPGFIASFFNAQLLSELGFSENFIFLPAIDQIANLIFMSFDEHSRAIQVGLIPSDNFNIK